VRLRSQLAAVLDGGLAYRHGLFRGHGPAVESSAAECVTATIHPFAVLRAQAHQRETAGSV
ncbi:MAG: hypothetical protein WKF43_16460, partial [Acidimicrobiales bacterium]